MPRRNQGGSSSGRRSSSSSDRGRSRSNSGRTSPRPKSFRKSDDSGERKSGPASRRSLGDNRGQGYDAAKKSGKPRSTDRPYKKSEGSSPRGARKTFGPNEEDTGKKGFGQRSRFAKPPRSSSQAAGRTSSRTTSGASPRTNAGKRFSKSEGGEARGGQRGASFGKPYKKTYRAASERTRPGGSHKRSQTADPSAPKSDKIRLNKFIANSGVSSRREADELIKLGLVSVNGKIISELGYKVNPSDEVRYEDKVLRAEKPVYILMNKPKGFITTTEDPQERKTVMHIVGSMVKERIYPVGRLDRNTTGLLLLTNDGDLADRLMHPSFNVKKVYKVELNRPLTKSDFQSIRDGVRLEEGKALVDDLAIVSEDGRTIGIELHIGWNRVVRRIFESLEYEVLKLDRTIYAGLDKKELARGQWRFLTKEEIIHLKHFK